MNHIERLAWATDLHLNFVEAVESFCSQVGALSPDGLVITGDISEAPSLRQDLAELDRHLWLPTWLVLGNHDFYHGSITEVRKVAARHCKESRWLHYLPKNAVVRMTKDTALVGHEGWADGRLGDYHHSNVMLSDYIRISELISLDHHTTRLKKLHELGDEAAMDLEPRLTSALKRYKNVIVATHIPPFEAAAWHQGGPSDRMFLPHFSCKAMGDMLLRVASAHPERNLVVLCGHTHSSGETQIADNLFVRTGGAEYGHPAPCGVLTIPGLTFEPA